MANQTAEQKHTKLNSNNRRTSKTSVACQACKRRKTKCSGGSPPCQACEKLATRCIIDPGTDMRRRDSKDNLKPFRVLLDAFVDSLQNRDAQLSSSLYRAIQVIDVTGKLAMAAQAHAQAYAQGHLPDRTPTEAAGEKPPFRRNSAPLPPDYDLDVTLFPRQRSQPGAILEASATSSPSQTSELSMSCDTSQTVSGIWVDGNMSGTLASSEGCCRRCTPSDAKRLDHAMYGTRPPETFHDLVAVWSDFARPTPRTMLAEHALAQHSCDPCIFEPTDAVSKAIISFRTLARQMISDGSDAVQVVGPPTLPLESLFDLSFQQHPESAWTWACRFVRTFPALPLRMQLTKMYIWGIQMRFFICPNTQTFEDLPVWCRPLPDQYRLPHLASIDFCPFPILKQHLLLHWHSRDSFVMPEESCNWPYSDAAMFSHKNPTPACSTLSLAFIEHIRMLANHTIDASILSFLPSMVPHVLSCGRSNHPLDDARGTILPQSPSVPE